MMRRRFIVTGLVQGVGFRWSARARATELSLTGWVRNLPDGRVEGEAQGEAQHVDEFEGWLRHGPPLARVDDVQLSDAPVVNGELDFH